MVGQESEESAAAPEHGDVRRALRVELSMRGHLVASDSVGLGRDLYIVGPSDLAKALFHFAEDAGEAAMTLYSGSGSWTAGLPPRFAVLPVAQANSPYLEMLEQMDAVPLYYDEQGGCVIFRELDRLLAEHLAH